MNRKSLLISTAALGLLASASSAATITLINGSFEAPATGKIQSGYDGATDIPGWINNDAGPYTDTGVENSGITGKDGDWTTFLRSTDGGAYQVTSYTIGTGDQFTLSWLAGSTSGEGLNTLQQVTLFLTTDGGATRTVLATNTDSFGTSANVFNSFTLEYTATAADAGAQIGIEFDSLNASDAWVGYDNFNLAVIPEPSALVLGVFGLAAFTRRRRA
ncbi:PEP-CTERM sorting domain-containing protein [Luteolibacter pohnpeiensis]|uniref:PEP-CTERM sorting domain-containing protein n=1 Tax=Luteolibacter pohnpeiensis TaxID=454153 RepID=A0A934SCH4_9BACT|nr:PEP-CTERM sorting domain-containing protein [Luteolibacter pohnpeiensis]MBK1882738.1 PEP-CTERM sorting domain-containing protein [Luteolibacter pohnpeiensis]